MRTYYHVRVIARGRRPPASPTPPHSASHNSHTQPHRGARAHVRTAYVPRTAYARTCNVQPQPQPQTATTAPTRPRHDHDHDDVGEARSERARTRTST
eukprot:scaffold10787_cov123-Isochrysis_galbana.AAC.9